MASITETSLTSELQAVNLMLEAVGEAPVTQAQLDADSMAYVIKAKSILNQVNREVQSAGWHFNTENEYPLVRDVDNHLVLPANTLRADTSKIEQNKNVVQRGTFLYDRANRTYEFTADIKLDLVLLLPLNQLPEYARFYIAVRAARRFHDRTVGSQLLHQYSEQDELAALTIMQDAEGDTADANMFNDSYGVASTLERTNYGYTYWW